MGKKKNKNKLSGAEKTAMKTEKNLVAKQRKQLLQSGEVEIAKIVEDIERKEAKRTEAREKIMSSPPTARAYASLTPHPTTNDLILFGGEYYDGKSSFVYNDLFIMNTSNNSWLKIKAPGCPPPRNSHQAVATSANKGELWIFGGEYTNSTGTQFHHFNDLWCFNLTEKKWEKVQARGGPCPRSGHRMTLLGRKLLVFGGYADNDRGARYFNDVYLFCLDTRTWQEVKPVGHKPSARSACLLLPVNNDSVIVYGGFSRKREDSAELSITHFDMFKLSPHGETWQWRSLSTTGPVAPPARCGIAAAVATNNNRAYVFGGITDITETDEDIQGEMSDSLQMLDLESAKWHCVNLKVQKAPIVEEVVEHKEETNEKEAVTVVTDEVFTMRISGAVPEPKKTVPVYRKVQHGPCPRMSAIMAVQRSVLYVYGGLLEKGAKQFYLGDMYSLDLHKLSTWDTLIEQPSLPDWLGSDSEDESSDDNSSDDDGDDEESD